jgi:hypothetical protein
MLDRSGGGRWVFGAPAGRRDLPPLWLGRGADTPLGDPVLSQCDVEALAFVFAWSLEGVELYPPAECLDAYHGRVCRRRQGRP